MEWNRLESVSYWSLFVVTFFVVAAWETRSPNRSWIVPTGRRWTTHGILLVVSGFISGAILGVTPVMAAVGAAGSSWGVLGWESAGGVAIPFGIRLLATVLVLDFVKYATHRVLHTVPWLWRVHRMHHSDPDFDVSTAGRVHPVEFIFVQAGTIGTILLLAPPPSAVLTVSLIASIFSFFGHANASLPPRWERLVRPWLVTPDLHRIHHSDRPREYVRNYGEIFPWWDQLLGSYQDQPSHGQLVVGMRGYQNIASMGLNTILTLPFHPERPGESES